MRTAGAKESNIAAKEPFANPEAECAILGKIMRSENVWWEASPRLNPDDFADPLHRAIYEAMQALVRINKPLIPPTVFAQLGDRKRDGIALNTRLASLRAGAPDGDVGPYVDLVLFESARRRALATIESTRASLTEAKPSDNSIEQIVSTAQRDLLAALPQDDDDDLTLAAVVHQLARETTDLRNGKGGKWVWSNLPFLDPLMGAMMPGDLIVLGGNAGMGKTSLVMQILEGVAKQSIPVDFYSLEMKPTQLGLRYAAPHVGASASAIREGRINDEELQRLVNLEYELRDVPLRVIRLANPTTATLHNRIARSIARRGTRLVAIDHLRLIRASDRRAEERMQLEQRVADIKATAMALDIPIIMLAHLARYVSPHMIRSARDIRRPILTDFYGSSAVENTADVAIATHRPSWFLEMLTAPPAEKDRVEWDKDRLFWRSRAELIKLKDRMAQGVEIKVCGFDAPNTRFTEQLDSFGLS